jgi:hypothetical protein
MVGFVVISVEPTSAYIAGEGQQGYLFFILSYANKSFLDG